MNSKPDQHDEQMDSVVLYVLQALPSHEVPAIESHIAACARCRQELETLRPIVDSFVSWPTDVLRPTAPLWERLAQRIASEPGGDPILTRVPTSDKPAWEQAAPGISVQILATDTEKKRVGMLVRLAAGAEYPPHRHAGMEELHLLDGELMIDDKKLYPGGYFRAEVGTVDHRVWSETGCTCVLLTSTEDAIL